MDLAQLRTIINVAELGSLSKAAERMRIAQPALSRQVRMLETELGTRLFDRHGRGMVLTDSGREVLRHATRVINDLEAMRAQVADKNASLTGRVAIGLPPTVADIISVPLVARFKTTHPQVELRLVSAFTGYLLDWLQRGEIDVAVIYDPQPTRSLRSKPLVLENLFLIGAKSAKLSTVRAISFAQLASETLLLPSPRHGLRSIVERCAAEVGISLKVSVEADSYATLKDLVRNGYGRTILPLAPIHADIAARRLTAAPLIEPAPTRRLVLSLPSDRTATRATRFAAEAIESVVTELVDRGVWIGQLIAPAPIKP